MTARRSAEAAGVAASLLFTGRLAGLVVAGEGFPLTIHAPGRRGWVPDVEHTLTTQGYQVRMRGRAGVRYLQVLGRAHAEQEGRSDG